MKILIVDDSRAMRMMLQRAIRQADGYDGVEFLEAADGLEAQALVPQADVICSDWNMPNCTGIELLGWIRGQGLATPFGFVTSEATVAASAEAFETGAQFHATKPFDPAVMAVALDWALGRLGDEPPALPANLRLGGQP